MNTDHVVFALYEKFNKIVATRRGIWATARFIDFERFARKSPTQISVALSNCTKTAGACIT